MDKLKQLYDETENIFGGEYNPGNAGCSLRSCGCRVASLNFKDLRLDDLMEKKDDVLSALIKVLPDWDIYFYSEIPAAGLVGKISLRKFCDHCRDNYIIEKTIGTHSIVIGENL
ncbi:MAG: DUF5402 family protein [Chloroflexi bacterium]|nr:DUF5402 family protein [Chloroflexota bacterium]